MLKTNDSVTRDPRTDRTDESAVELRPIDPGDADRVAEIVYTAFAAIHDRHRFARDFPHPRRSGRACRQLHRNPSIWGVVAEREGRIIGSNFVDPNQIEGGSHGRVPRT